MRDSCRSASRRGAGSTAASPHLFAGGSDNLRRIRFAEALYRRLRPRRYGAIVADVTQLSTSVEAVAAWLDTLHAPIRAIWIPDVATLRRRQLLRVRVFLVLERTRIENRIHGHLTAENLIAPGTDLYGKGGRAWLASVPLSPVLREVRRPAQS